MSNASKCVERLLEDLNEISQEHISNEDYQTASDLWGTSLMQRQYYPLKNQIKELHCGISFASAVEMLKNRLSQEKPRGIGVNVQMIKSYGAQTRLPERD